MSTLFLLSPHGAIPGPVKSGVAKEITRLKYSRAYRSTGSVYSRCLSGSVGRLTVFPCGQVRPSDLNDSGELGGKTGAWARN